MTDEFEGWQYIDELSVNEAVLLIVDVDPMSVNIKEESFKQHESYQKFILMKRKLTEAISSKSLKLPERIQYLWTSEDNRVCTHCDWDRTKISPAVLRPWLEEHQIPSNFFFPSTPEAGHMNQKTSQPASEHTTSEIRALEAEKDDLRKRFEETEAANRSLEEGKKAVEADLHDLRKELASVKRSRKRVENTYLHIIGSMLTCLVGENRYLDKSPVFKSEAELVDLLTDQFSVYAGLTRRTLNQKFAEAKRSLEVV